MCTSICTFISRFTCKEHINSHTRIFLSIPLPLNPPWFCSMVQPVIPLTDSPLACGLCGAPGVTFSHTAPNQLSPSSGKTEKSFLSCVQCGLSRCNICARACARMSSVWWCEASVESLWHPDVFQFSPHACTHTQGTALIVEHSRLIWLPGGGGCWVGPNRISPSIYRPYSIAALI